MDFCQKFLVFLLALAPGLSQSQEITYTKQASLSVDQVRKIQAELKSAGLVVPQTFCGIDLYKVTYPSKDEAGTVKTLSGLLAVPQAGTRKGLILFCHGTSQDRRISPSRYTGQLRNSEAEIATMAFATGDYAVAMPDYLGLGDDESFHPYPYGDLNSRSGIDLVTQIRANLPRFLIDLGPKNFVTGYSEGGAVAMWTVKNLSGPGAPWQVAKAAPLSGPYDLSGVTAKSLLDGGLGLEDLAMKVFLMSYVAQSAAVYRPNVNLEDYFDRSFATYIPFVFDQKLDDVSAAKKLTIRSVTLGAYSSVHKLLKPSFVTALKSEDLSDPLLKRLAENNCFDWSPSVPIRLVYLTTDSTVVPTNSVKALSVMQGRGVVSDLVAGIPLVNRHLNHLTFSPTALGFARQFFDSP